MKLELKQYRDNLEFETEVELNTMPIKIDLLIIRKSNDVKIENDIGRIFKGHNIFEYKSPKDALDVDTFYKGIGYACLYKSKGKTVDEIKVSDITLSFVRERKPGELFNTLERDNIPVIKNTAVSTISILCIQ